MLRIIRYRVHATDFAGHEFKRNYTLKVPFEPTQKEGEALFNPLVPLLKREVQMAASYICACCQRLPCEFFISNRASKTANPRFLLDITALWIPTCNRDSCRTYACAAEADRLHHKTNSRTCRTCSSNGHTKKCSHCKQVTYCCETCQQRDWSRRKRDCKANETVSSS